MTDIKRKYTFEFAYNPPHPENMGNNSFDIRLPCLASPFISGGNRNSCGIHCYLVGNINPLCY